MTSPDRAVLKEAAEKATAGPWISLESGLHGDAYLVCVDAPGRLHPICAAEHGAPTSEGNAAFIALANPATVLVLLADLEAAEKALAALKAPQAVHLNMLRGGIAKLTPAQIGHLYRGEEGVAAIAEIIRQNPDIAREALSKIKGAGTP